MDKLMLDSFNRSCNRMKSFDFSIDQPAIVGKVKRCTYSELDGIANFKNPQVLQKTTSGRLFRGIIVEGPKERSVIVKTWDFLLPSRSDPDQRLNEFCDEIELFTDERVNMHPSLVKLYGYCCDTRLAFVFDEEFTGQVLWDVLLSDDFGWDEWMKVVTQLADLFSCLHENKIAFGCVTPRYIMIDKESNIKVFDYGYVTDAYKVDPNILHHPRAPEILKVWDYTTRLQNDEVLLDAELSRAKAQFSGGQGIVYKISLLDGNDWGLIKGDYAFKLLKPSTKRGTLQGEAYNLLFFPYENVISLKGLG